MAYIKASTARIRRPWTLRGHLRGLGASSAIVGGTLQVGPSVTSSRLRQMPYRGTPRPVWNPVSPIRTPVPSPVVPTPVWNPVSPSQPVTGWGGNPPQSGGSYWAQQRGQNGGNGGWGGGGGGYDTDNPAYSNNLAQLTLQYQSNPSSLTEPQWQQLQAAGVIPSTVPYSNASLVNPAGADFSSSTSGIDPATGVPYATELAAAQAGTTVASGGISTALSTPYAGIPLYIWLGGGALLFVVMSKRGR